jgi:hypothetical protein
MVLLARLASPSLAKRPEWKILMALAKLLAVLLVVGLTLGCTSEAGQESAVPAGTATPGQTSSLEATAAPERQITAGQDRNEGRPPSATSNPATAGSPAVPPPTVRPMPTTSPSPEPSHPGDRMMLTGTFTATFGDPPPGSGLPPRMAAVLVDIQGRRWRLLFDDTVFRPSGSLLDFSSKRVNIEGTLTTQPDTVLVMSLSLIP